MPDPVRPRIAVLGTGGTIAGLPLQGGPGYRAGALSVQNILSALPDVDGWLQLHCEQLFNVGSQNIAYADWLRLAARVQTLADGETVDGIVITHGTDTLEETAYFLDQTLCCGIPVVLTGAMRPAHAVGADGPGNVLGALAVAASRQSAGRRVLVVMNEQIHSARDVQKTAATGVDAFASPNSGPAGWVQGRDLAYYSPAPSASAPMFGVLPETPPRVFILHVHADADTAMVRACVGLEPDGIVMAGVGNGNAPDDVLAVLSKAAADGIAVVRASRTGSGRVVRNAEIDDDNEGFIVSGHLSPQKARIRLMLALTQSRDPAVLQTYFTPE
jgi:L-asparaginase